MKELKLHATCQCQECDGNGYLHDDRWNEFYKFCVQWEKQNPPVHPEEPGFNEWAKHEDAAQSDWWAARGHPGGCQNWPPDEYPCPACQGSGFQEITITLEELAKLLGRHEGAPAWLIEALNCGNGVIKPTPTEIHIERAHGSHTALSPNLELLADYLDALVNPLRQALEPLPRSPERDWAMMVIAAIPAWREFFVRGMAQAALNQRETSDA